MHSSEYLHGIRLFNRAAFFEAHEALEDVWRAAPESEKKFLQGLIQIAVGLHHYGTGNLVGARSLLGRAARHALITRPRRQKSCPVSEKLRRNPINPIAELPRGVATSAR